MTILPIKHKIEHKSIKAQTQKYSIKKNKIAEISLFRSKYQTRRLLIMRSMTLQVANTTCESWKTSKHIFEIFSPHGSQNHSSFLSIKHFHKIPTGSHMQVLRVHKHGTEYVTTRACSEAISAPGSTG